MRIRTTHLLLVLAGCGSATGPEPPPAARFGAITALVDGKRWASTHPLDQVIAAFDPQGGQLAIRATLITSASVEVVSLSVCPLPNKTGYSFGSSVPSAFGHLAVSPQARNARGTVAAGLYSSSPVVGDTIVLTSLDLVGETVEGFFRMTVAQSGRPPIRVEGRFSGKLQRAYLGFCVR